MLYFDFFVCKIDITVGTILIQVQLVLFRVHHQFIKQTNERNTHVPFHVVYSVSTQNDSYSWGCFVEGMHSQGFFVSTSTDYEHDHILWPRIDLVNHVYTNTRASKR